MFDLDSITQTLKAAGADVRSLPRPSTRPHDRREFLTQFQILNTAATDILRDALSCVAPDVGWLDLENVDPSTSSIPAGTWWVCDPIDGAIQLIQGINQWSISLALVIDGVVKASWVYDAVQDEMFHAARGEGAYANGAAMHPSTKRQLADAVVTTSHAPDQNRDTTANRLAGISYTAALDNVGAVRNLGPTSLQIAWVADGRLDGFWAYGADASNWLAGELLASEAGATVTDTGGVGISLQSDSILISGPHLHAPLRQALTRSTPSPLIDGRSPREFVQAMANDCFPPTNVSALDATERWTTEDGYRQVTNGVDVSRGEQIQHLAYLQAHIKSMNFDILHAVFDGKTLAVLQQVDAITDDGGTVKSEVAAFFTIRRGRIVETIELTRAIQSPSGSQQIHTVR
jgi:myo-inositol-1(or 4)-monophosphatase